MKEIWDPKPALAPDENINRDITMPGFREVSYEKCEGAITNLEGRGERVSLEAISEELRDGTRAFDILEAVCTMSNATDLLHLLEEHVKKFELIVTIYKIYRTPLWETAQTQEKTITYTEYATRIEKKPGAIYQYLYQRYPGLVEAFGVTVVGKQKRDFRKKNIERDPADTVSSVSEIGILLPSNPHRKFEVLEQIALQIDTQQSALSSGVKISDVAKGLYEMRKGFRVRLSEEYLRAVIARLDLEQKSRLKSLISDL
ncbi:hypothetical protein HY969_03145 [Candidatus Kaiserbacteria bacterium]|nr:hypothetical protein [Candidatus Kaiserbacteria bacterium]